ncbi:MAG: CHRD domain-containing protein, partial [Verrucomicrobiales bacterium]|nr:CHRD domain-containing protein [Verrucomicrobiales bacterium]
PELPNGYVQGKAYIASFVEGSPADKNANPGAFEFDLTGIELKGAFLTVTANYSKAPAGTHNAEVLTSPFSAPVEVTFKPGSIESVGLTRIVPDTIVGNPTGDALGNWEPYTSVLGTSTFLIEGNTFADQTADQQRYVVALQPAAGGAPKLGEGFFTDAGAAYKGPINLSRQNGNPGRVAGDKRPGAVNFITGGEVSLHGFPEFTSDTRWGVNGIYSAENRFAAVQTFSLDPATLTQTSLTKAFDPVDGQNTATFEGNAPEVSRFGGELAALDNGNFVVVIDDRSNLIAPRRTATAAIITPTGQIIKGGFAIDGEVENQIWSNVAAHKGGFCVRFNATLHFFDNAGNLLGKVPQTTSGLSFDGGRGDGTRIAGHINSPYVFLAGKVSTENVVKVAVWDSRDRTFVTAADVSEGAFTGGFDRANLAVDALNRLVVSWVSQPAGYEMQQVAARVLAFNESTKTIASLTTSFLPFANAAPAGGIRTLQMSVSMTTKQILVAAKGEINLENKPELGATSPREVNFYTIISHPDPKDDPTPPAGAPPSTTPGQPEDNGLVGKTATFYINTPDTLNNANTESLGVAIASNGNVIIGWEDDGEALTDLEAVWTMFDNSGQSITPNTQITTLNPDFAGQTLTSKFLAYFRADKSAVAGRTSWGPKIHANLFGDGLGMGATSFELGIEVPELAAINVDAGGGGDFPSVQLLANEGQPVGIVTGLNDADAEPEGDVRIADWEFLANGNIVVVGESRQRDDLVNKYGGSTPANHAIYRIVSANGTEVKATALASATPDGNEIWHGAGVTKDGFAIRFAQGGRGTVRLFDNSGAPVGGNIDLGTVAKDEAAAGGGRGDSAGFHGNGNDAYVAINGSGNQVRLTVLNADGSLRYSRSVTDVPLKSVGRADAAITSSGQVFAVFSATYEGGPVAEDGSDVSVVMGRLFEAAGDPAGGTFYVSEKEVPTAKPLLARNPRVAWRGNTAVVAWESQNSGQTVDNNPVRVVAARFFTIGAPSEPLRIASITVSGGAVTLAWSGGEGPFLVQGAVDVRGPWFDLVTTTERSTTQAMITPTGFFRIVDKTTKTVKQFRAVLSGAAERPNPITTTATGMANISIEGSNVTYLVAYSGLTGPATAGHFHGPASATETAGVMLPFVALTPLSTAGVFGAVAVAMTDTVKTAMETGQAYANIHTAANGGGEIRGQVVPATFKVTLTGAAERPNPVTTTATGSGTLTLIGNQLIYNITYSGLSAAATAGHIHGPGTAEQAAGVLVPFPNVSGTSGTLTGALTLDATQLTALLDGLTYVNIHTSNNPGGEIRGQILP